MATRMNNLHFIQTFRIPSPSMVFANRGTRRIDKIQDPIHLGVRNLEHET